MSEAIESIFIEINGNHKNIIISSIYRPPGHPDETFFETMNIILEKDQ